MKYAITYSSKTGNTRLLAETVNSVLPKNDIIYFGPLDEKALEADRIYLGFWTNDGVCDDDTKQFIQKLSKQQVFLFGTAGLGSSIAYYDKIIQRTRSLFPEKAKFFASFMCQGKLPAVVREKYVAMKNLPGANTEKINGLIKEFDNATTHPSKDDLRHLAIWLKKI